MDAWLANYWWLLTGLGATGALVIYRVRRRGGSEPLWRRIEYALFPNTDPAIKPQRMLSPLSIVVIGGALLLILFVNLLILESRW